MQDGIDTITISNDFNMMYAFDIPAKTRTLRTECGWAEYTVSETLDKATIYVEGFDGEVLFWESFIGPLTLESVEEGIREVLRMKASTKIKHETWHLHNFVDRVQALDMPDAEKTEVLNLLTKASNLLGAVGLRLAQAEAVDEYSRQLEFSFMQDRQ